MTTPSFCGDMYEMFRKCTVWLVASVVKFDFVDIFLEDWLLCYVTAMPWDLELIAWEVGWLI